MAQLTITNNPYEVLCVPYDSDLQVIKAAYKRLILQTHPDKLVKPDDVDASFQDIQSAYAILSDGVRRSELDRSLLQQRYPYQEVISLSDLVINTATIYSTDCRCGGEYSVGKQEVTNLKNQSISILEVPCSNCSLAIVVHLT